MVQINLLILPNLSFVHWPLDFVSIQQQHKGMECPVNEWEKVNDLHKHKNKLVLK